MDNYMAPTTVERAGLRTRTKKEPYELSLVDGEVRRDNNGMVTTETSLLTVARNSSNAPSSADFSLDYQVTIVDRHIGS
jgi:hypothetical protein